MSHSKYFGVTLLICIVVSPLCRCIFLVVPEDLQTGLAGVYGFSPRIFKANDHRLGFGFRFGDHADLQVLYEFGPQMYTKPLQPIKIRSASYRQRERVVRRRRRPILDFLFNTGLLRETTYEFDIVHENKNEPR